MKKIFFIVFLFVVNMGLLAQDTTTVINKYSTWELSYKKALKKAKKERKPLLVYFKGSDWCGPCKKLDKELFNTDKFKEISKDNFILYEADIPRNKDLVTPERLALNKKLASKFRVTSYPTILFLNGRQKILGIKKGLILTEYYYPFFESVIKK